MKKIGSIILTMLFVLASSCNKDDNSGNNSGEDIDRSANLLATGESANDILSNTQFDKLKIEVAFVEGFRPTVSAMDGFVEYLRLHTFKQNIEVVYKELPSPGKSVLELQEIADLEKDNRTVYNDGKTLAIYIYFADAPSDEDDETEGIFTLGAVYRNTSMVIYESTVRRLAGVSSLISNADVELATLNHEFGHLFGLVNIGTNQVNAHEDTEAPNHCNVNGCLMKAELRFQPSNNSRSATIAANGEIKSSCSLNGTTVMNMLQNNTSKGFVEIPPLDAECILDLQSNGGK